jgi:hypothetical protein
MGWRLAGWRSDPDLARLREPDALAFSVGQTSADEKPRGSLLSLEALRRDVRADGNGATQVKKKRPVTLRRHRHGDGVA